MMIQPLVYEYSWNRRYLWERALEYIATAAALWKLDLPEISDHNKAVGRVRGGGTYYGLYTFQYTGPKIFVRVHAATEPPRVKGRVWSYPGYKIDRTCAGILAHEFGHHIWVRHMKSRERIREWENLCGSKMAVSGYEPVPGEAFAETARVYILNPDLLLMARPERAKFFSGTLGLKPLHYAPWRRVLANAPDFIVRAAERFTKPPRHVRERLFV